MSSISQKASRIRDKSIRSTPGSAMSYEQAFYKTMKKMCPSDAEVARNRAQSKKDAEMLTSLERKIANSVRLQYVHEYKESLKILPFIKDLLDPKDNVKIFSSAEGVYLLEVKFEDLTSYYNSSRERREEFIENFKQLNVNIDFDFSFVTSLSGREAYRTIYEPILITNNEYSLMYHDTEYSMHIININQDETDKERN